MAARRLGAGEADAEEIKAHAYFRDIDWFSLLEKTYPAPHVPQINNEMDISYFDEDFTSQEPYLTPSREMMSQEYMDEFKDFTFIADWALQERVSLQYFLS